MPVVLGSKVYAALGLGLLAMNSAPAQVKEKTSQQQSRYRVIGPIDRASGVGVEFTLSAKYKRDKDGEYRLVGGGGGISQTSSKHARVTGWYVNSQGFVRVDLERAKPAIAMAAVVSQDSREVNGCPTTLVIENSDIVVNGHPMQYYILLVRPRGQSVIYLFQTVRTKGME